MEGSMDIFVIVRDASGRIPLTLYITSKKSHIIGGPLMKIKYEPAMAIALVLAILALSTTAISQSERQGADIVLLNGTIYTVNEKVDWDKQPQEALAISGKKIAYVGNNSGALNFIGPSSRVVNLEGKMVLPGFIESHIHPSGAALFISGVNLAGVRTSDEYLKLLKNYSLENPNASMIRGFGWVHGAFGSHGPTKEAIDAIVSDKPVVLFNIDGHSIWVNSKALEMAEITKDTPDPEGGIIERDASGNPSGTIRELSGESLVLSRLPAITKEEMMDGLQKILDTAAGYGITTACDVGIISEGIMDIYSDLDKAGKLSVRIRGEQICDPKLGTAQVPALVSERKNISSDLVQMRTAKMFIDGVTEAHTALLLEPYANRPDFKGKPVWDPETFNETIAALDKEGFQIEVHSFGDGAVRMALDAYENAMKENGRRDSRHKAAHVVLLSPQDLPRFKSLGVIPTLSPNWYYYDSNYYTNNLPNLGEKRAEHMMPMKSIVDSGAVVATGSDFPACGDYPTLNPLDGIRTGIVRLPISPNTNITKPLWPEESEDLKTLIELATINGAYASFLENETGSLEAGKMADLIVLDKDLFNMRPEDINKARVLNTILEGREVYGNFSANDTLSMEDVQYSDLLDRCRGLLNYIFDEDVSNAEILMNESINGKM
jgi:predicted amidohydrolase YtcJ